MNSPYLSRVYNAPSNRKSVTSSPRSTTSSGRHYNRSTSSSSQRSVAGSLSGDFTVDIFIPNRLPTKHRPSGGFSVDIRIPSSRTYRRPKGQRSRASTTGDDSDDGDNSNWVGWRSNARPPHIHQVPQPPWAFQPFIPPPLPHYHMLVFHFSPLAEYADARRFAILNQTVHEVFPRIDMRGRQEAMLGNTFRVDRFCTRSLLRQVPSQELVEAYNFIFPIILQPRPIWAETQRLYENHPPPELRQRTMRMFLTLSLLLSQARGLGCGGWLAENLADAIDVLWVDGRQFMDQDQQISMFIANLEPFVWELGNALPDNRSVLLDIFGDIWAGFSRPTQFRIEETIREDESLNTTTTTQMVARAFDRLVLWLPTNGGDARLNLGGRRRDVTERADPAWAREGNWVVAGQRDRQDEFARGDDFGVERRGENGGAWRERHWEHRWERRG